MFSFSLFEMYKDRKFTFIKIAVPITQRFKGCTTKTWLVFYLTPVQYQIDSSINKNNNRFKRLESFIQNYENKSVVFFDVDYWVFVDNNPENANNPEEAGVMEPQQRIHQHEQRIHQHEQRIQQYQQQIQQHHQQIREEQLQLQYQQQVQQHQPQPQPQPQPVGTSSQPQSVATSSQPGTVANQYNNEGLQPPEYPNPINRVLPPGFLHLRPGVARGYRSINPGSDHGLQFPAQIRPDNRTAILRGLQQLTRLVTQQRQNIPGHMLQRYRLFNAQHLQLLEQAQRSHLQMQAQGQHLGLGQQQYGVPIGIPHIPNVQLPQGLGEQPLGNAEAGQGNRQQVGLGSLLQGSNQLYPPQQGSNQLYPPQQGSNQLYPPQQGSNQLYPPQQGSNQQYPPQQGSNQLYPTQQGSNQLCPPQQGSNQLCPPQQGSNQLYPQAPPQ